MKRFWLVLLSLGLVMAFSASAFAVDVKFSGNYQVGGFYVNKTTLNGDTTAAGTGPNTAFYFQRLQLTTEFVAAPGVSVVTRANIMERVWGATRATAGGSVATDRVGYGSAAYTAENENIGFDYTYLRYASPIGLFQIGYQSNGVWGTVFGDSNAPSGRLSYLLPIGKFTAIAAVVKTNGQENSYRAGNTGVTQADRDGDVYYFGGRYVDKNVEVGLLYGYVNNATGRQSAVEAASLKTQAHGVAPYVKATIGPVKIQAEINYYMGKVMKFDSSLNSDVDLNSLGYWVNAVGTFGPVYVGGTFAYSQGQSDETKKVTQYVTGGTDWSPALIMWNQDRAYWFGNLTSAHLSTAAGASATTFGSAMTNAYFIQANVGVKPNAKLDINAAISYAYADTTNIRNATTGAITSASNSKDYGYEIDVTGTYNITNNLSYMLGVGYLITGDYFKGTVAGATVSNDYLVINKLTLTF